MPADHGDAPNLSSVQGQNRVLVLEQHDALFFQALGDIQPACCVDDAFLDGIVHDTGKKLCVKNSARMVIDLSHRHQAVLYCLSQRRPKVVGHGLLLVHAGRRSLLGAVRTAPIG